jgi:hypothetical protein
MMPHPSRHSQGERSPASDQHVAVDLLDRAQTFEALKRLAASRMFFSAYIERAPKASWQTARKSLIRLHRKLRKVAHFNRLGYRLMFVAIAVPPR